MHGMAVCVYSLSNLFQMFQLVVTAKIDLTSYHSTDTPCSISFHDDNIISTVSIVAVTTVCLCVCVCVRVCACVCACACVYNNVYMYLMVG